MKAIKRETERKREKERERKETKKGGVVVFVFWVYCPGIVVRMAERGWGEAFSQRFYTRPPPTPCF